jgi:excinuclease ABC subunit C
VKNQYRKFNIRTADLAPGDDYAMMREVLTRRVKRLAPVIPDEATRAEGERRVDPGPREAGSDPLPEVPDSLAFRSASGMTGGGSACGTTGGTRIEPPQAPPVDQRGSNALAFGVLRADDGVGSGGSDTDDEEFPSRPDVLLIDGGLGQLGVAREVLAELGIGDIALIAIAKGPDRDAGREHFHLPGRDRPTMLEPRDPVLYFVQRLRDEAHRFAIGTHRAKRSKAIAANPLDDIPGIGPRRKRALLAHFGSAKAVSRAGREDLTAVEGISAQMAQVIYDFFHERQD